MYTESQIQDLLHKHLSSKGHEFITPNVGLWVGESDLVSCTQSMYGYEYEIKVTRSDFLRDKKKRRHKVYSTLTAESQQRGPSRFYYATPPGLIDESDLPQYAGLLYVDSMEKYGNTYAKVEKVREAPRRHMNKIKDDRLRYLGRGLTLRYWKLRRQIEKA